LVGAEEQQVWSIPPGHTLSATSVFPSIAEVVGVLCRLEEIEQPSDPVPNGLDGPRFGFSEECFERGKNLLDQIEVWRVGRREQQMSASRADQLPQHGALVGLQIVQDDNIPAPKRWSQSLLDIGRKGVAVDRSVEHERRGDAILMHRRLECHSFPMAMLNFGNGRPAAAALLPATRVRHVGSGPRFVNENETGWNNPA
jgi:hypothetical protein